MRIQLECTPLGNQVKFRLRGQLVCTRCGQLRKSMTLDRRDCVAITVFGSQRKVDAFLKANRKRYIVVEHHQFHIDNCDKIV